MATAAITSRGAELGAFALHRLLSAVPTVFMVLLLGFLATRLAPGDPVALIAGEHAPPEMLEELRKRFGLDRPLPEQFLLYLDRPTVNFGHRRWLEGPQESYDASAWLNAAPHRVLLVPEDQLEPCFPTNATKAGRSSDEDWYLVRGPASAECAAKGDLARAISYASKPHP